MAMLLVACLVMMASATWGPPVWYQGQYWQQWQEDGSWHPVDGWNRRGRDDPPPGGNWDQQWGQQQSWQESSGWSAWPEEGHSNRWDRSYTRIGEPQTARPSSARRAAPEREASPSPRHRPRNQFWRLHEAPPPRPHNFPPAAEHPPPRPSRSGSTALPEKGNLKPIPEEDGPVGLNSQSSSDPAPAALEATLSILKNILQRSTRYDGRGFRAQLRRNLKYQLKQHGIPLPDWLDDQGQKMSVNQFRQRAIQWMNLMRQGQLEEAQLAADALQAEVSNQGLPGDGSGEEDESDLEIGQPGSAAVPSPSAAEAACLQQAGQQAEQPAEQPAEVVGPAAPKTPLEELEEKVDDLGDHVAKMKAKCDLKCPPLEEGVGNSSSTSSSNASFMEDTRKTKSEPPASPKPMHAEAAEVADHALPEQGTQDVDMATAAGAAAETGAPPSATHTGLPGEGIVPATGLLGEGTPISSMDGSWQEVEPSEWGGTTVESMTLD